MLSVTAHRPPVPVHPAITEVGIAVLVDCFYARVRADARLGPIFAARLDGRWPEHMDKMRRFWSAVLLRTGGYKGQPLSAHRTLGAIRSDDYRLWLEVFRATATDCFGPDAAREAIAAAERIAESFWLATFAGPGTPPPDFLRTVRAS